MAEFGIIAEGIFGWNDSGIVAAAARAGAIGILNLEGVWDLDRSVRAVRECARVLTGGYGVKIDADWPQAAELLGALPASAGYVVLVGGSAEVCLALRQQVERDGRQCLLEVTSRDAGLMGAQIGAHGVIAKGNESGGRVGEETTFVLLQSILAAVDLPVWAHGGIGVHSAAACLAAGACGVVLDSQLLLTPESCAPLALRHALERLDGEETVVAGAECGQQFRVLRRPGSGGPERLVSEAQRIARQAPPTERAKQWNEAIRTAVSFAEPDTSPWPLGQDAALAAPLALRFHNVAGIVNAIRRAARNNVAIAGREQSLSPGSRLAEHHRLAYPIFQGPMTRVSDVAEFADAVSRNGGLPFLALALLDGARVRELLIKTKSLLGERTWGVGILGFVPPQLRAEQLEVVREVRPSCAIIAGGRPDQASELESIGIETYLHVPTPALLRMFLEDGARHFIFEGRECGGHVGPRASFVLWELMIAALLDGISSGIPAGEIHAIFAGGIHDARSAAMVAAMTAPLAERGVSIGVLMGTAYLFTQEAVQSGAVVEGFQTAAMECKETVLLDSGLGHTTRCAATPFNQTFLDTKSRLLEEGKSTEEIRDALEQLNLGRLRIASKGIARVPSVASQSPYAKVPIEQQRADGMYMIGQVAALRSSVVTIRDLHEDVSAGSQAFLRPFAEQAHVTVERQEPPEPPCDIAIVGMSSLLPEGPDLATFWRNLLARRDAIIEIPAARFDPNLYFDPDRKAPDKIYSRWGGFLESIPFDPMRYGIPPNALSSIDPAQLFSLVAVERALQDSGYDRREFNRERASVILGLSGGLGDLGVNYAVRSNLPMFLSGVPKEAFDRMPEWTEDSFAGILLNVVAGRVANRFDLGGVNFAVDAACASSLAAVYLAARELANRTSDMAIVGGVDTVQSPFGFLCFSKSQALSPTGRCRPFDETADGIAISEGVTILVLRRLADAERDGDKIYAVIKGVAGSSDGRGRSMTAPRQAGQVLALRRAYAQARFDPSTIGLIEAHGTGTVAGDETELESLNAVFTASGAAERSCVVGSVKSMIGHTKAAAGVTGLLKTALALYYRVIPPTLNVTRPNIRLRDPKSPFFVTTTPRPWLSRPDAPRRAGVSSFGFGGANFHAALEEYTGETRTGVHRPMTPDWPTELFCWSSAGPGALDKVLASLEEKLDRGARPRLCHLAAAIGRTYLRTNLRGVRLAIVARSVEELRDRLKTARTALQSPETKVDGRIQGVYLARETGQASVAFLFPGQGSQYPGMLREAALYLPEFRTFWDAAAPIVDANHPRGLHSYVYPPDAFTDEERKAHLDALTRTGVAQPALAVVEIALCRALERLGIRPSMTAGHSFGEYVALAAGGVVSEEDLFRLAEGRGQSIETAIGGGDAGAMAAASAPPEQVREALAGRVEYTIANLNAPRQTIIAGSTAAIQQAMTLLEAASIPVRRLPVACAFHSPFMEGARQSLSAHLANARYSAPSAAVYSNTLAQRYPSDPQAIADLLDSHLVKPVRFAEEIRAMHDDGARVFLEVGPKGVLTGLTSQILEGMDASILSTDSMDAGFGAVIHAVAQLHCLGCDLRWEELYRGRTAPNMELDELLRPEPKPLWLLNGARAFPASDPYVMRPPVAMPGPSIPVEASPVRQIAPAAVSPAPVLAAPLAAAAPSGADADAVMLQYQQVMTQFLQSQTAVMTAFLRGGGAPAAPDIALPHVVAAPLAPTVAPEPVPAAAPAPVAAQSETVDIQAELIRITSERTGYPADLLNPDAGIESDLGIDSIKRVEILASLQRTLTPDHQAAVKARTEKLTRARTLREIASEVIACLPAAVAPAGAVAPIPQQPAGVDVRTELIRITSQRTGYPPDMLNLQAAIEADLGIDSIKRVEILGALQRLLPAPQQTAFQAAMDKLTRAASLQELIERIVAALAVEAAPVAQPQPAAAPAIDARAELIRIASERTGYPAEMLNLTAAIEGDLGIDSLKRVEILSRLQRLMPPELQTAIQSGMEKLTRARTFGDIAGLLESMLQPKLAASQPNEPLPRLRMVTKEIPAKLTEPRFYPGRVDVIVDDEKGVAARLAISLRNGGEKVVLLRRETAGATSADGVVYCDLTAEASVASALETVRRLHGPVGAIFHLLPLSTAEGREAPDLASWRLVVMETVRSLYLLVRGAQSDLEKTGPQGGATIAAVTARGGRFGQGGVEPIQAAQFGVADWLKTLALELEGITCRIIDVDPTEPAPILHQKLLDELTAIDDTLHVGRPGNHRLVEVPQIAPIGSAQGTAPVEFELEINRDSVVVLTGGARGITSQIARELAKRCRPVLILAGGSSLPKEPEPADTAAISDRNQLKAAILNKLRAANPAIRPVEVEAACQKLLREREIRSTMRELETAGSRVEYHAVDVRDEASLGAFLDGVYDRHGRLDVFIHGAGIIEDKLLRDKTPESFDRVLHTKADSAFLLARLLRPGTLKSVVFMSSISAVFGNRGQSDYAAANGIMNGIAISLSSRWNAKVVALAWGPWDQGGMVTDDLRQQFLSRGVQLISPRDGALAVLGELRVGAERDPLIVCGGGPWVNAAVPPVPRPTADGSVLRASV